ncbi:protease [Sulfolobales Mexican rudivirus 1]|uniref:Uncharacterized protein n=1 Tax=Sulfolobales Mexican rod-shaped virus 1 TaxID=2848122 RepID=K4NZG3_9VIRU|nr:protease [Sulfolobales Mexican rudivirus 1]AFV51235.1 hypothetical protein [Sulfolobales Mexican rod-shaped virus 1]
MTTPVFDEKDLLLFDTFFDHSFLFNPRDPYSFLRIAIDEKAISQEKIQKMLQAYKAGTDSQFFQTFVAYNNEIKLITKILSIKTTKDGIEARLVNGVKIVFDPHEVADNPEDFFNLLRSYFYVKLKKKITNKGIDYEVETIASLEPPQNVEVAKELFERALEQHVLPRLLLQSFGYDFFRLTEHDIYDFIVRLLPLFHSPLSHRHVNIIEITNRGTGKTTTFLLLREIFNFRYYVEMPTFANLIYDARNNLPGAVFLSDGLIFDEIQNWRNTVNEDINSALSTGLENCTWSRGAGTESREAVRQKCLPIVYSGNPLNKTVTRFEGDDVHDYMKQYTVFTDAILDRIHVIHVAIKKQYSETINARVLFPSVLRSFIDLIQQHVDRQTKYVVCDNMSGRRQEQAIDLQLIFQGLDFTLGDEKQRADEICDGLRYYMRMFAL